MRTEICVSFKCLLMGIGIMDSSGDDHWACGEVIWFAVEWYIKK